MFERRMGDASTTPATLSEKQRLEALLARLRGNAEFPALSAQVSRIQVLAGDEQENLHRLAEEILKDVALTQKLLRVVNAAPHVAHRGGVSTVSRALSLIGLDAVRGIAASLVLLEQWKDRAQSQRLREAYARALLAAQMAAELCGQGPEREEVFLAGLFQGLGRMLTECFFPAEAQRIRAEAQGDPAREHAAVLKHLGVGYDALTQAVARDWGFPEALCRAMERPTGPVPPRPPQDRVEWVRWVAAAGTDLADAWLRGASEGSGEGFRRLSARYGHLVNQSSERVAETARQARSNYLALLEAVDLARSLSAPEWTAWLRSEQTDPLHPVSGTASPAPATPSTDAKDDRGGEDDTRSLDLPSGLLTLAQGLQDATAALLEGAPAPLRVELGLETLHRALGVRRTWLVKPGADGVCQACRWLGDGAAKVAPFYCVMASRGASASEDLLATLGRLRKDTRIECTRAAHLVARLPQWYGDRLPRDGALLVFPLWRGDEWIGWIHADGPAAALPSFGATELALLRAIRHLLTVALKDERI
jgi:HD-like signal output (HDOD) protein